MDALRFALILLDAASSPLVALGCTARSATTWPASTRPTKDLARRARLLPPDRRRRPRRADAGRPTSAACSRSRCVGVLLVYALQRLQAFLPYSLGLPAVPEGLAFNTAVSFVTNTNWQSYSPELTMGYTVQLAGLAVQNFVSAAVGIAVAVALDPRPRPPRQRHDRQLLGRPHPRHPARSCCRSSLVAAVVLLAGGVIQNFAGFTERARRSPAAPQTIPGGPVASQEAIKLLGTNGGGFFNANSAHPFENPTGVDEPVRDRADAR